MPEGCYVAASYYLDRFTSEHPSESGELVTVNMGDGLRHTIALVTWQGSLWARDDQVGLYPVVSRDASDLERGYAVHSKATGKRYRLVQIKSRTRAMRAIEDALGLIGAKGTVVRVGDQDAVLWHPRPGLAALYVPGIGTGKGETTATGKRAADAIGRAMGLR